MVDVDIRLRAQGGDQAAGEIAEVQERVAKARADVERFAKLGGIGAISVGADKINAARANVESLGTSLLDTEQRALALRNEVERLSIVNTAEARDEVGRLRVELAHTEAGAANLREELTLTGRELREQTADSVGYLGDIDSSLQAIGGAFREFGSRIGGPLGGLLTGAGEGAQVIGEVFAVAEALPRLASAADQLRESVLKAVSAAAANTAAQAADTAAETANTQATVASATAEGGLATARRAAVVAAGGVGAGLAGTALALGGVQLATAGTREEAQRLIVTQRKRIEVERELGNVTAEQAREQIDAAQAQLEQELLAREFLINAAERQIASSGDVAAGLAVLGERFGVVGTGINELIDEIEQYSIQIDTNRELIERLNIVAAGKEATQGIVDRVAAEAELNRLREEASGDEVRHLIDEAESREAFNAAIIEEAERRMDEISHLIESGAITSGEELRTLDEEFSQLNDLINNSETAMHAAAAEAEALTDSVLPLAEARDAEAEAADRAVEAIEEMNQARQEELDELIETRDALRQEQSAAADALSATQQQLTSMIIDRSKELERRQEEALIQSERTTQEQALLGRIAAAKEVAAQRAKNAAVGEVITEGATEEQKILAKSNDAISKINQEFMSSELRAIEQFQRDQGRLREDLQDDLRQAELDNDVNAFIRIQREGLKALGRGDQDFLLEREQALDERQARIDALKEGQQQELVQLQSQVQERLSALGAAGQQELTQVQLLEQQLAALREQFQQEDAQRRLELEERAFNDRLQMLQRQQARQEIEFERLAVAAALAGTNVGSAAIRGMLEGAAAQAGLHPGVGGAVGAVLAGGVTVNTTQVVGDIPSTANVHAIAQGYSVAVGQQVINTVGRVFKTRGFG